MVSNIFVILISIIFICCALSLGYAFGKISSTNNTVKDSKTESHCGFTTTNNTVKESKTNSRYGFTPEELERMPIWDIVRYTHNDEYDCVWSSMHTKRDADKRCKALNEDYHKYYGKYVVERNSCI